MSEFDFGLYNPASAVVSLIDIYNNESIKKDNLPVNRDSYINKNTIKDIFINYWPDFYEIHSHRIRYSIKFNVEAMMKCGTFNAGYTFFSCPSCNNFHIQAHTCKSRFCPSCNNKYRDARAINISSKLLDVNYRHIVFTIPSALRVFFRMDRRCLNALFDSVNDVLKFIPLKTKKSIKRNDKLGFMLSLHTYGRSIDWNPHIHCLVAECVIDDDNIMRKFSYLNYDTLRKSFRYRLLHHMKKYFGENMNFQKVLQNCYDKYDKGFYVYAPPLQPSTYKSKSSVENVKSLVEYITRYAAHPPIAQSRITNVDYTKDTVSYYYDHHTLDNIKNKSSYAFKNARNKIISELNDKLGDYHIDEVGRVTVTEDVYDFIGKLIVHIPDYYFHTIRHYGFMANRSKNNLKKFAKLYAIKQINKLKKRLKWIPRLLETFNYNPILCPCGSYMEEDRDNSYYLERGS